MSAGKLVMAGVVTGAAVFGGLQLRSAPPTPNVTLPTPAVSVEQAAEPRVVELPSAPVTKQVSEPPDPVSQPNASDQPKASEEPRRAQVRRRGRSVAPSQPTLAPVASSAVSTSDSSGVSPVSSSTPRAAEAPAPPVVRATEPAVRKRAEADILFEARKLLSDDPAGALRLAEEHNKLYANGLLAPEREVLAIEALRALSQTRAADQRLQRFRERYPDSLHLRRLERARP